MYDYIDDILVASATKEDHLEHLREVCHRLAANGIVINPNKCVLGAGNHWSSLDTNWMQYAISHDQHLRESYTSFSA